MHDRATTTEPAANAPTLTEAVAAATQDSTQGTSVTYIATLPLARASVQAIAARLLAHRLTTGTPTGRRSLGCFTHAVLFARWLCDATRVDQLAVDSDQPQDRLPLPQRGSGRLG